MKAMLKELAPNTFVTYKSKRWVIVKRENGHVVLRDREGKQVEVKADKKVSL
ncbi:MAG: hypothetical protein ACE5JB_04395 [bacterium]